jgi:hypothetical protein
MLCPSFAAAAIAAERDSLMDEIRRMIDVAQGVTECVNEMLVNKNSPDGELGTMAWSQCWLCTDCKARCRVYW